MAPIARSSGFFSRKNLSTAVGLVPILGTVQSAVELATGYDYIGGEEADRRLAAVGLVPGGKGIANGAKGIINAAAPLARQTTILGTVAGAANALRKNAPIGAVGDAAAAARRILGDGYKTITNKAGDTIFLSQDGLRKMRFDFNNTSGDLPHVHIEEFINGRWRDAIPGTHRIYPQP